MNLETRFLRTAGAVRLASGLGLGLGLLGACAAPSSDEGDLGSAAEAVCTPIVIDTARSLMVTDPTALALFPLKRVLDQLVARAGTNVPQTSLGLYQQWFDTLNDAAHAQTTGPHCTGTINGFPSECPRTEGILAATNPFPPAAPGVHDDTYHPTALVFRVDLTPSNGSTCGEARIVYAKASSSPVDRNFLIFEGSIPNPSPSSGLAGCLPIAQFWAGQSAISDALTRAKNLEAFYFTGLPAQGNKPLVDPANYGMGGGAGSYGGGGSGQIRANLFLPFGRTYFPGSPQPPQTQFWQLREFKTARACTFGGPIGIGPVGPPVAAMQPAVTDGSVTPLPTPTPMPIQQSCQLEIHDVTTKNNPSQSLFADVPANATFQSDFIAQITPLATQDLATIGMNIADKYNTGESNSDGRNDYVTGFNPTGAFASQIAAKLAVLGRTDLTPTNIVDRTTTQSCGGCHQNSNGKNMGGLPDLIWPNSNPFTMIDEQSLLSPALVNVFLPHRKQVLEGFVNNGSCGGGIVVQPQTATLGGNALN